MCAPYSSSNYITALFAIEFATTRLEEFEAVTFLKDWQKGNLEPWPEWVEFLKEKFEAANV